MRTDMMDKFRDAAVSVAPIMAIVIVLHATFAPLPHGLMPRFVAGGVLLTAGLAIFLIGAEIGMVPFGQRLGAVLTLRGSLPLIVVAIFIVGVAVAIAEPGTRTLGDQVAKAVPGISENALILLAACGIGLMLVAGMLRVLFQWPLPVVATLLYGLAFAACVLVHHLAGQHAYLGVSFDAGGATTGPITVPFIMAVGIGAASSIKRREGGDNSFGFVGLATIGPVMAVALMGFFAGGTPAAAETAAADDPAAIVTPIFPLVAAFSQEFRPILSEIGMAMSPILAMIVFFHFTMLRLPRQQLRRIFSGMGYCYLGLVLFMTGVRGGFTDTGFALGGALGELGGWALLPVGMLLGAVVVCAEPTVWVLGEQVESLSGGHFTRRALLAVLAASIAVAMGLAATRVLTGLSLWYILVPGYAAALFMARKNTPMFSAIAFDSGAVASGPMAVTFVLSIVMGASKALEGDMAMDALGVVALITMAPMLAMQAIGRALRRMESRKAAI